MRYRVELVNRPTVVVEAQEFSARENGIVFYSMRNRPREGRNDQWGNPLMQRMQVSVAYFSNVESIMEIPEGEVGVPQMAEETVPFEMGGNWLTGAIGGTQPQMWYDEAPVEMPEPPALAGRGVQPIPVDPDGINWDAERDE